MIGKELEGVIDTILSTGDLSAIRKLGSVGDILSSTIRAAIRAQEGSRLLVVDFASVEARCLAWLAKQDDLVGEFHRGDDVYCSMATAIYGRPITKKDKAERFVGKTVVLGCGYQMGADRFQRQCEVSGVHIDQAMSQKIIKVYRSKNRRIRNFWFDCEKAAKMCVHTGDTQKVGYIRYYMDGDWLRCRLPSGRDMSYFRPELDGTKKLSYMASHPKTGKLFRKPVYGGLLVENITQAVCRDILVASMSRLEKAGYKVIMHVHDEVVCEMPYGSGSVEEMESIMRVVPAWAEGLPVGVEGFETERYRK
jgi:DNA polymerase